MLNFHFSSALRPTLMVKPPSRTKLELWAAEAASILGGYSAVEKSKLGFIAVCHCASLFIVWPIGHLRRQVFLQWFFQGFSSALQTALLSCPQFRILEITRGHSPYFGGQKILLAAEDFPRPSTPSSDHSAHAERCKEMRSTRKRQFGCIQYKKCIPDEISSRKVSTKI